MMRIYEIFCAIRTLVLIGVIVALIIVLTGCGDDKTTTNNVEVKENKVEEILTEDILTEEIR